MIVGLIITGIQKGSDIHDLTKILTPISKVKPPDSDEDVDDDDSDDGDMSGCADMDDVAADLRIHSKDEAAFAAFMTGATRSVVFRIVGSFFCGRLVKQ